MSLLIGACSSKPTKKLTVTDWQTRQSSLAMIDSWSMHARIGLRSQSRSGSATLLWDETPASRKLRLLGPLGGGTIHLQQDNSGVTLQDSKGKRWQAENAAELIYQVTGWQIPVSALRWWVLGLTEPGSDAEYSLDESQHLVSVRQQGWQVTLGQYNQFGEYQLPTNIVLENESGPEDEQYVRARLIIKDWKLDE